MKKVKTKTEIIETNTIVVPDGFSGWVAYNLGSAPVSINGIPLEGNTTLAENPVPQKVDFSYIGENAVWDDNIKIVFTEQPSTFKKVLLIRLKYN